MSTVPLPIAALAAASHVAPSLVAPIFRRMMLKPRRNVRPPPVLSLPLADERIALGDGLVAWRWGQGPSVLLVHGLKAIAGSSVPSSPPWSSAASPPSRSTCRRTANRRATNSLP